MSNETDAAPEATETKPKIGVIITEALLAGKSDAEALEAVKAGRPDAKTSITSIRWYRTKLRSDGHDVPTAYALRRAAKATTDEAPATDEGGF